MSDEQKRPVPGASGQRRTESRPAARPGAGRPAPRTPGRRPEKPYIPFVRFEDIVVRCGHVEKFGIMPDNKDRFREDRRKKAMSRDCKACREKKQQQEQEAAAARRAEKEKRRMEEAQRPAASDKARRQQPGRLPDGSRFEVGYDAAREQWSGTLTIPNPGGEPAVFTGSGSGLFPLLASLDSQYRATMA
jgi:hypothetical protein